MHRSFLAQTPQGIKPRDFQTRLLSEPTVIDAVPESGQVRLVTTAAAAGTSVGPFSGVAVEATPARFEDGFMVLLQGVRVGDAAVKQPTAVPEPTVSGGAGDVVVEVRELVRRFGKFLAVDRVSFNVTRGEIFGLLGPNGAGKTSTLSAIEGLIKPNSGAVFLDGLDIRRHPAEVKARLGVQLQATSFQSQLTIKQIVRLYAGLYGVALSDSAISEGLHEIGLQDEASKPFKQLSGGQQQRLSLYVAVLHRPELLLLDEPTAGLDPQSRRQLWGRIEHIRQEGGSIILTTHSMEEAEAVCDRVAIIDHGHVLTTETPKDLNGK
jgi:ABC-2 type transport system ATP-binding protein